MSEQIASLFTIYWHAVLESMRLYVKYITALKNINCAILIHKIETNVLWAKFQCVWFACLSYQCYEMKLFAFTVYCDCLSPEAADLTRCSWIPPRSPCSRSLWSYARLTQLCSTPQNWHSTKNTWKGAIFFISVHAMLLAWHNLGMNKVWIVCLYTFIILKQFCALEYS